MTPLQQLERSIASGTSLGANEHADGARRIAAHVQSICADPLFPLADTTGTTPRSNMSRRHYGCPLSRTPRADDGRLVPAGLLARGSCTSLPPSRRLPGSGMRKRRSPLTVAGAAAALRREPRTAFPFHPPPPREATAGPSRAMIEAARSRSCQQDARSRQRFTLAYGAAATALQVSDPPGLTPLHHLRVGLRNHGARRGHWRPRGLRLRAIADEEGGVDWEG